MDIHEQIERFKQLSVFLETDLPKYAQQVVANDVAALVTNRVVQTGKNYKGSSFKKYSTNTVAAWRFWGKSRTRSAEEKVRTLARARGGLSYREFRTLNNLEVDKKNFEFTGEMWRKFGIVRFRNRGKRFKISLGGTSKAAQDKIDSNSEREGISIIEASENEERIAQNSVKVWIEDQANRILNG